jgi:hypothetical protein
MELPDDVGLSGFPQVGARRRWIGEPVGPAEKRVRVTCEPGMGAAVTRGRSLRRRSPPGGSHENLWYPRVQSGR